MEASGGGGAVVMSEVPLQPQAGRVHGGAALAGPALSSDTMHLSIGLRMSTPPQNRQLVA